MNSPTTALLFSDKVKDTGAFIITHLLPNGDEVPLYNITFHPKSKPHVKIMAVPSADNPQFRLPPPLGEVTYHSLSSKIDLLFYGEQTQMKRKDTLSTAHYFNVAPLAPLSNGSDLKWKESGSMDGSLKLLGKGDQLLAKYRKKMDKPFKNRSGIEITVPVRDRAMLDAIVVTGVALAKYRADSDKAWGEGIGELVGNVAGAV